MVGVGLGDGVAVGEGDGETVGSLDGLDEAVGSGSVVGLLSEPHVVVVQYCGAAEGDHQLGSNVDS
jgi:hypothetical protein